MDEDKTEFYGDPGISSNNAQIPRWLKWVYFTLPIWGLLSLYYYWDGSRGWLDRGYWEQLQKAANTTFSKTKE